MDELARLAELLRRRRAVIADHAFRDRDPDGHLAALREVSEEIGASSERAGSGAPARLRHFLANCSYDKALAFLETDSSAKA
jgi:hypothetical protein